MSFQDSASQWIEDLKKGDRAPENLIFQRYFERLVALARKNLPARFRRVDDEEDAVQSALKSFFDGLPKGEFPQLSDQNNLWSLLAKITLRKVADHVMREKAQKRGGGLVQGEEALRDFFDWVPGPEEQAEFMDTCERLFKSLPSDMHRQVVQLRLQSHTRNEIATKLGCSERTVARHLAEIRMDWGNCCE